MGFLSFKKINILLFSDTTKKMRQFRTPQILLVLVCLLLSSIAAILTWTILDYVSIKPKMAELDALQRKNTLQDKQFTQLVLRIRQMNLQLGELQEIDRKFKIMLNFVQSDEKAQNSWLGGSGAAPVPPDSMTATKIRDPIGLLDGSFDNLGDKMALDSPDNERFRDFLGGLEILFVSTLSAWPTEGWVSSRFGHRLSPFTGMNEFHKGIDIATNGNPPVAAPADGIVSSVGWDLMAGNVLYLNHGYGLKTKFAHLQKVIVRAGQHVKLGDTVAFAGNTGRSTGTHLHYEIHLNGVPVDPLHFGSFDPLNRLDDASVRNRRAFTLPPEALVVVSVFETSDPNETFAAAQDITEGTVVGKRNAIEDSADFYKVRSEGGRMNMKLESSHKGSSNQIKMTVFDQKLKKIGENSLQPDNPTLTFTTAPYSTHYVKLDLRDAPVETPRYRLQVSFE